MARAVAASAAQPPTTVTLTGSAVGVGTYNYHSFVMAPGVNRLDVVLRKTNNPQRNAVGVGIFDTRGAHYGTRVNPNGFRGIFGEERSAFTITPAQATGAFIPGPLPAGTWTLIVPVFTVGPEPLTYEITVTMAFGDSPTAFVLGRDIDLVRDEPGWYRGDLHAHTQASSDALSSGSAMQPADWARTCKDIGLDFLALTDHNVVSQNFAVADATGDTGVLLMAGEEMTNWFYGHATVSGISPGDWFDWRQLPGDQLVGGVTPDERTGRIQDFLTHARSVGAFVSAAHPLGATLAWRFFGDAVVDPAARTDSLEVWTGPFQPDDQASVDTWDAMLRQGQRLVANGGSDLHGVRNTGGFLAGTPTTVVHAPALGKRQVIEALRAGRSFVTRVPRGVELYLAVQGSKGQRQIMGGTVYGAPSDLVDVELVVRRGAGMRLVLLRDGTPVSTTMLTSADQTVRQQLPLAADGYLRAEVRSAPVIDPVNPLAGRLDMEALSNPVWLRLGAVPDGTLPDPTQPPPAGPVPALPEAPDALLLPVAGAALGAAVLAVRRRQGSSNGARAMTHSEFRLRADDPAWCEQVVLSGQVTAHTTTSAVLTRWVPGCCSADAPLHVTLVDVAALGAGDDLAVGEWWEVTGSAVDPRVLSGATAERTAAIEGTDTAEETVHAHPAPVVPARPLVLQVSGGRRLVAPLPPREA